MMNKFCQRQMMTRAQRQMIMYRRCVRYSVAEDKVLVLVLSELYTVLSASMDCCP